MAQQQPVPVAGPSGGLVRAAALVVALVFLAVGVLGFIPAVTTDYDALEWYGPDSGAEVFGVFQVSILHNIVHLVFALAGLLMARTSVLAKTFLLVGGLIYLGLWVYGMLIDRTSEANFVPVNTADNWLHLGLGVGMLLLGALPARREAVATVGGRHSQARHSEPHTEP